MKKAIIGKKVGMTQVFSADGTITPVTVVEAGPCTIIQKKTKDNEGYDSLCVAFDTIREKLVNKPMKGQFEKANTAPCRYVRELPLEETEGFKVGDVLKADVFAAGDVVDVIGKTRGRGFTGTVQRWNTHTGPMAHGSKYHRGVGSLSANTWPARVFKNKGMPGQYGQERVTIQNLTVVRVDAERNLLLIKGGVPGTRGTLLFIRDAVKK
jgi:large subunit ribosomal protein L3